MWNELRHENIDDEDYIILNSRCTSSMFFFGISCSFIRPRSSAVPLICSLALLKFLQIFLQISFKTFVQDYPQVLIVNTSYLNTWSSSSFRQDRTPVRIPKLWESEGFHVISWKIVVDAVQNTVISLETIYVYWFRFWYDWSLFQILRSVSAVVKINFLPNSGLIESYNPVFQVFIYRL